MQNEVYLALSNNADYRTFRNKKIVRSVFGLVLIAVFWMAVVFANNINTSDAAYTIVIGILIIISVLVARGFTLSLIKKPNCGTGIVKDKRLTNRTVTRCGDLETQRIAEYEVSDGELYLWGKNVASYTGKNYCKIGIGDRVIWFSLEQGVYYLIKEQ